MTKQDRDDLIGLCLRGASYAEETLTASAFEHLSALEHDIAQRGRDAKAFLALAEAYRHVAVREEGESDV